MFLHLNDQLWESLILLSKGQWACTSLDHSRQTPGQSVWKLHRFTMLTYVAGSEVYLCPWCHCDACVKGQTCTSPMRNPGSGRTHKWHPLHRNDLTSKQRSPGISCRSSDHIYGRVWGLLELLMIKCGIFKFTQLFITDCHVTIKYIILLCSKYASPVWKWFIVARLSCISRHRESAAFF